MTNIDTSAEAIASMVAYWTGHPCYELAQALAAERDALGADCIIRVAEENQARHVADTERDRLAAERDALKRLNAEYEDHIGSVEAERDRLAAKVERMREALETIHASHVPDQPAAGGMSREDWAYSHVGKLRAIAGRAVNPDAGKATTA